MTTDIEEILRTELHQAVEHAEVPTDALVRTARQRGVRAIRRKKALRFAPVVVGMAAVVAAIALIAPRTTSTTPIATTANEHPASNLAAKLAAALPAGLQEQIVQGSLGNKNTPDGAFGFVMVAPKGGRVMFQISVVKASSDLARPLNSSTDHLSDAPRRSSLKARLAPVVAQAKSGAYVITVMESWLPDPSKLGGTDLLNQVSRLGSLPMDQAALQRIANETGWTVSPK